MKPLPIGLSLFIFLVLSSSSGLSALATAAERPTSPAEVLLWFLSLNTAREQADERPKIDVNSATAEALSAIPGLDRRQALQIIAHRPYATLQELGRAGLSTRFITRLTGLLTVDSKVSDRVTQPNAAPAAAKEAAAPTR
jgi:DNA uptake protein ComE-like DNA-binding protein